MDIVKYAHSFQAVPRPGLERIRLLLSRLGDPQCSVGCIHIAGTNGKGSVAMLLSSVLCHAGFTTGLYISPNLLRPNERISVNGADISDEDLDMLLQRVCEAAEQTERETGELASQFEIWTAAAFLYFKQRKCDYVVLEAGLGGEFDATNVIDSNVLSVLTHIDLDHTALLGDTAEKIARTKCGIFKADCSTGRVICAPQTASVEAVICETAQQKQLSVTFVRPPLPRRHDGYREVIGYGTLHDLALPLCGVHQIENACITIEAARALGVPDDCIREGVAAAKHPGRMELLRSEPPMIYDGGHNPNGIASLVSSLVRYAPDSRFTVIFAAMKDKDTDLSLRLLGTVAERFIFTTVQNNPRALSPEEMLCRAEESGVTGTASPTLAHAIDMAADSPTLICGSLYLYADLPDGLRSLH